MFGALIGGLIVLGISLLITNFGYDDVNGDDVTIWAVAGFLVNCLYICLYYICTSRVYIIVSALDCWVLLLF